jgi:hypothetical protein
MRHLIASSLVGAAAALLLANGAAADQGFCVLPSGLTRVAESSGDCRGEERFLTFVGQEGAAGTAGADGADGTACSVSQGDGSATIDCTDGTIATVQDGAEGPAGPPGPPGPEGSVLPLCELAQLNQLEIPFELADDCSAAATCPCFDEDDLLAAASECAVTEETVTTESSESHNTYTTTLPLDTPITGEFYAVRGEVVILDPGNPVAGTAFGCSPGGGQISSFRFEACRLLIENTLGPCEAAP